MGEFIATGTTGDGFTMTSAPATFGLFPNNDIRALSRFIGSVGGAESQRIPSALISE
jgi:hypothetical protein